MSHTYIGKVPTSVGVAFRQSTGRERTRNSRKEGRHVDPGLRHRNKAIVRLSVVGLHLNKWEVAYTDAISEVQFRWERHKPGAQMQSQRRRGYWHQ
jgi:hypothetical protein